ncbi:hypothetical protein AN219_37970 [Streptomyces nanshensis]|nr:hypothetical protein AN219_37970 [Streptomyces nanshensis]
MLKLLKAWPPRRCLRLLALGHCAYGLIVSYTVEHPSALLTFHVVLHSDVAATAALLAAASTGLLGGPRRRSWIVIAGVLALVAIARLALPPAGTNLRWWTLALAGASICITIIGLVRPRKSAESNRVRKAVRALGTSTFCLMISGLLPPPSAVLGGAFFVISVVVLGGGDEVAKRMQQREWLEEHFGTFEEFLTTLDMRPLHELRDRKGDWGVLRYLRKQFPHLALKFKLKVLNEVKARASSPGNASTTFHGGS